MRGSVVDPDRTGREQIDGARAPIVPAGAPIRGAGSVKLHPVEQHRGELRRRGFHAVNGDTDLAYQLNPETGEPTDDVPSHSHHIWRMDQVRALVADRTELFTFFCGGSRNFSKFVDLFDGVFVLQIDLNTLNTRLDQRPQDEFGAHQSERDLIVRLQRTGEDIPNGGIVIDATAPLGRVVDEIVRQAKTAAGPDVVQL